MDQYIRFDMESKNILDAEVSQSLFEKLTLIMIDPNTGEENPNNLGALVTYLK